MLRLVAALAITGGIEDRTGLSIKKFVRTTRRKTLPTDRLGNCKGTTFSPCGCQALQGSAARAGTGYRVPVVRPSVITVVLLAAALALAGNLATNTVQVAAPWWPYGIWATVTLLVICTVAVEISRRNIGLDVSRVSRLTDPIRLGVHRAAEVGDTHVPPFVRRDRQPDVENALVAGGFVLIVGDSTAGKTRLAYEAMRVCLPRHLCIRPLTPESLPAALALAKRKRRTVVWLDDLERYLGHFSLMTANPPRFVVLATMRTYERDDLSHRHDESRSPGERQSARAGREVLNSVTTEIRLDRMWSPRELALAGESVDERIAQALVNADNHGIAESMAASPQLLQQWQDARDVRGAALVSAAVDARRAGYHRPLPVEVLRELHTSYLPRSARPGTWEAALAWATQPMYATSSLLEPAGDGKVLAFDYLIDAPDPLPIPVATWEAVFAHADPSDLEEIAWRASFHGQVDMVEPAFDRVLGAGLYREAMSVAACLADAGREERAVELFEILISRATGVVSAEDLLIMRRNLAWELGEKVAGKGDPVRALEIARQVVDDCTAQLGEDHLETLEARLTFVRQLGATGSREEALALARAVHERASTMYGPDHWTALGAWFETAVWTRDVHGHAAGADEFRTLAEHMVSLPEVNLSMFVDALWNLGGALIDSGGAAEAVDILAYATEQSELAFGHQHHRTLHLRLAHLNAVGATGDRAGALDLARQLPPDDTNVRAAVERWSY